MFKYQTLFFAVVLMCCVFAAEANHNEGCTDSENVHFDKGQSYKPDDACSQFTCNGNNEWSGKTCPAVAGGANCKTVAEDLSKPYPECCETVIC